MAEVRYFAAAAEAAGCTKEVLEVGTVGELKAVLSAKYGPDMDRVLSVAAFLVGDDFTRDTAQVIGSRVDVLPPFAGG
ncbi:MoaD/ThiS family protein [Antrihabitans stalactiti]|uniref:MoaD/ThiS family protein n=1 Tax=Antrihabitans stalactiti TaxID=2584121 RepID=UPI003B849893